MKITFDRHIGIFEDAVPKEYCENLIKVFEDNLEFTHDRADRNPLETEDLAFGLHIIQDGKYVELCRTFSTNFFETFYPYYAKEYKVLDIYKGMLFVDDFKIQKTQPTEGYHQWHAENSPQSKSTLSRVMVYTLYLNDIDEGGETEFLVQSKRIKPKQGTLCIFPSGYTHIHRGNPPLSKTKYIMTGWISFIPNEHYKKTIHQAQQPTTNE